MATSRLTPLTDPLATRARSIDFAALGQWLPNPDPILKAQGKDIAVYRELRGDALVGACIRRRKAAVKSLEWGLDRGQAASRTATAIEAMLAELDMERLIGQMLEATLYGYQPLEVQWKSAGGLVLPVDVQAKPPEWFCFDSDNQLRFKSRSNPMPGELLPNRKFLLPRQDPTYQNPYGFADLSLCFWPLVFKKGGMKFWLAFAEKFGSAFSVGKLPRTATSEERAQLLDSLEALIQDGVATIPDDGSVELVEMAGKSASADLYERLVLHCRGEIAIALLGQNQTTEASANKASAGAGLEVTRDLRDGDAKLVQACVNQLIRWTCELNWGGPAPVWSLWDQEAQDALQAARDKSNYDAGARFTNAYFERAYGYQAGDLAGPALANEAADKPTDPAQGTKYDASLINAYSMGLDRFTKLGMKIPEAFVRDAFGIPVPTAGEKTLQPALPTSVEQGGGEGLSDPAFAEGQPDALQTETDTLATQADAAWAQMLGELQALVARASSTTQLQQSLLAAYGDLDSAELVKLMAAALALAELRGMDDARQEL